MRIKMWCLIKKTKSHLVQIGINDIFIVGFATKKGLLETIKVDGKPVIESDEEIKKIMVEI